MGAGNSLPSSTLHNGISFDGNYPGHHSVINYDHLHTDGAANTQGATLTGAGVTANVSATVPVGLQNLAHLNANKQVAAVPLDTTDPHY